MDFLGKAIYFFGALAGLGGLVTVISRIPITSN
jgi:hypothetical protein